MLPYGSIDFSQPFDNKEKVPNFVAFVTYLFNDTTTEPVIVPKKRYGYKITNNDEDLTFIWVCDATNACCDNNPVNYDGINYKKMRLTLQLFGRFDSSFMKFMLNKILQEVNPKVIYVSFDCMKIISVGTVGQMN